MPKKKRNGFISFVRQSVFEFVQTGSFVPSSKYLAERMVKPIIPHNDLIVVELGAGTGVLTKAILKKLPISGRLLAFEINPLFINYLRDEIHDPRLEIIEGDAARLTHYLKQRNIDCVDYIISGLPLGNFKKEARNKILHEIKSNLKEGGVYVQFQYLLASIMPIKKFFPRLKISFESHNIPPAFVIVGERRS